MFGQDTEAFDEGDKQGHYVVWNSLVFGTQALDEEDTQVYGWDKHGRWLDDTREFH